MVLVILALLGGIASIVAFLVFDRWPVAFISIVLVAAIGAAAFLIWLLYEVILMFS